MATASRHDHTMQNASHVPELAGQATFRQEVRASDRNAVRRLVQSTGFFTPDEEEVAVELVEEHLSKGAGSGYLFLFAEVDGAVVGYTCFGPIACTQSSYDLYWIVVRNEHRGRGVGRLLLERSESLIALRGGCRVYVETSSRGLYRPTHAFYRRCGYRAEATLKDFYAPGDDKLIFVKAIEQSGQRS